MTELGNRLKEARIAKGLSIDDLSAATKIQKRYLVGIEEGNYATMPGNFYVRAFIKQYAEAVQLDPDEIFEMYKSEIPAAYNEDLPEQISRVKTRKTFSHRSPKIFDLLPKVIITILVISVAALIYYFLQNHAGNNGSQSQNKQNQPVNYEKSKNLDNASTSGTDQKKKSSSTKNKNSAQDAAKAAAVKQTITVAQSAGSKTTYQVTNADKFVVKVVSRGNTWVNIQDSKGTSRFQGMLKTGGTDTQTVDLSNDTQAVIVVGNTIDTDIYVNDQKIDYAVPPTQVVRQDITIQYVPKNK